MITYIILTFLLTGNACVADKEKNTSDGDGNSSLGYARIMLDSLYGKYSAANANLLRESCRLEKTVAYAGCNGGNVHKDLMCQIISEKK